MHTRISPENESPTGLDIPPRIEEMPFLWLH